ncbi:glycosyltransferase family 2 protein [Cyclobacterium plantarum]|uniref:Glycosyltransferase family 2 protein n=1 Tax=Cyclobacterium plantarum TaxID=2716263 RepID=A0ABX0HC40_9BACT|nr:glycosyltransferase family A protein [Cyclobacterium plantarum]NHE59338.1 glycosyltransferase family 2 protein [Cyclobacterium plantarum]
MKELYFSIIIPLYNKEDYIGRCLESVINQTQGNFECIVVDDGSVDQSIAIVTAFSDKRIRVISKDNGGVSSARNVGIQSAKYDYLAFLDADDYWSPFYLEEISELIGKYPNRCLYFSSYYRIENGGKNTLKSVTELASTNESVEFDLFEYFREYQIYELPFHTSCCVVNKKVILQVGDFDERISYYEDYDFFSRVSLKSQIIYLNTPLTFYCCDINPEKRLTGNRPPIERHWVSYILNGQLSKSKNDNLQFYINNMAAYFIWGYRKDSSCLKQVKLIKKEINSNKLFVKSLLLVYFPVRINRFLLQIWIGFK